MATMHPLLAAAACRGNFQELEFLLSRAGPQELPSEAFSQEFRDQVAAYSSGDLEQGTNQVPSLLEGVTVEGDTALHLVAANGEVEDFLKCADLIHGQDRTLLLSAQSKNGDTPLHRAASAGKFEMVKQLIALARGDSTLQDLIRKENNRKETALHDAVSIGDNRIVMALLEADRKLACFPEQGTSPLYLAIQLKADSIAQTLYDQSEQNMLSYSGPNGQNALHAAVLRGAVLTRQVLEWNRSKDLTTGRDEKGSTPLHFAASIFGKYDGERSGKYDGESSGKYDGGKRVGKQAFEVCKQVFEANMAALYQPDNDGLYPIHVAATVGARKAIAMFVERRPSSAGLRDVGGRTFLHIAVEKNQVLVVRDACRNRSLQWILNMQDNRGNTALHLAVMDGSDLSLFCALLGNKHVNLNLTNAEGQTPRDIAQYKIRPSLTDVSDPEFLIPLALRLAGASRGVSRGDHFDENYENLHGVRSDYETKEMEILKDSAQAQSIGSVLIASVTFTAMFTLPGGYRADDHVYGGTPIHAGKYVFSAFVRANTLAFILSAIATVAFTRAGSSKLNLRRRKAYFNTAVDLMQESVMALALTFVLAAYAVLVPVAPMCAFMICGSTPLLVLYNYKDFWVSRVRLACPLYVRKRTTWLLLTGFLNLYARFFLLVAVFCIIDRGRNNPVAQAPAPAPAMFTRN